MNDLNCVVVAYSGGLDTSVILSWVKERYQARVVAFCADLGQGEELDGLEEKALATGADKFYLRDLQSEFVRDYVFPAIQANAVYESYYLLGTALARPVIAKHLIDIAQQEGADAICHGATGKGNDQVRFELSAYSLMPEVQVVAPWREWDLQGREQLMAYARERNIPIDSHTASEKPYSMDRNLMHISYEGGILEDPWMAPPKDLFRLTVDPQDAPDEPVELVIRYEKGLPVAVDGQTMAPAALLRHLNEVAGTHGVGRVDIVENRFVGIKSRGVYETPGGTVLIHGHRAVESITLDREVLRLRDSLIPKFTELVYNGFWFSPEMDHLRSFMSEIQEGVTGEARLRLYKGKVYVLGRRAPESLYSADHVTFESDDVYDQADANGFIKLNALRLKLNTFRRTGRLKGSELPDLAPLREGFIE